MARFEDEYNAIFKALGEVPRVNELKAFAFVLYSWRL
jgi:hypothetical protein